MTTHLTIHKLLVQVTADIVQVMADISRWRQTLSRWWQTLSRWWQTLFSWLQTLSRWWQTLSRWRQTLSRWLQTLSRWWQTLSRWRQTLSRWLQTLNWFELNIYYRYFFHSAFALFTYFFPYLIPHDSISYFTHLPLHLRLAQAPSMPWHSKIWNNYRVYKLVWLIWWAYPKLMISEPFYTVFRIRHTLFTTKTVLSIKLYFFHHTLKSFWQCWTFLCRMFFCFLGHQIPDK